MKKRIKNAVDSVNRHVVVVVVVVALIFCLYRSAAAAADVTVRLIISSRRKETKIIPPLALPRWEKRLKTSVDFIHLLAWSN